MENFRLKAFRTVADNLNFRQAAEALYLTQPAVTLQIKALEEELGVPLFDRTENRVALTEAGRILLKHAKKVEALTAVARQELARLVGEEEGDLSAGASTTIAQYLLPKLIGQFRISNPKIRLSLVGANTEKIVRGVLDGTLAMGLIEGPSLHRGGPSPPARPISPSPPSRPGCDNSAPRGLKPSPGRRAGRPTPPSATRRPGCAATSAAAARRLLRRLAFK